jgi:hypothetical protein
VRSCCFLDDFLLAAFATPVLELSAFPALTTLTVLGWYRGGFPAATLLQSVSSHNVIQRLHIRIPLLSKADLESLRALDINIGRLPLVHLDRVTVTISRNETNWTGKDAEELFVTAMCGLRDFFPTLGPQGFLTLAYVHGELYQFADKSTVHTILPDGVQIEA